jgi:thioredoxin 1
MIVSITNANYASEIEHSTLPVVVDAYASWCGPCQQMMPEFEALARELSSTYKFAKLNVDDARDIAIKHGISSVPTLLFIKGGKVVAKEVGFMGKNLLKSKIETHLK